MKTGFYASTWQLVFYCFFLSKVFAFIYLLCVYVSLCMHACVIARTHGSCEQPAESVLSFHQVGPGDWTQVIRLYPLKRLSNSHALLFFPSLGTCCNTTSYRAFLPYLVLGELLVSASKAHLPSFYTRAVSDGVRKAWYVARSLRPLAAMP